jgi:hypothetical protein
MPIRWIYEQWSHRNIILVLLYMPLEREDCCDVRQAKRITPAPSLERGLLRKAKENGKGAADGITITRIRFLQRMQGRDRAHSLRQHVAAQMHHLRKK